MSEPRLVARALGGRIFAGGDRLGRYPGSHAGCGTRFHLIIAPRPKLRVALDVECRDRQPDLGGWPPKAKALTFWLAIEVMAKLTEQPAHLLWREACQRRALIPPRGMVLCRRNLPGHLLVVGAWTPG